VNIFFVLSTFKQDISAWELQYGGIPKGSILIVRTGWSQRWTQGAKAYLGYDEAHEGKFDPQVSTLSFPSQC
jgi:kynurenine formamidase